MISIKSHQRMINLAVSQKLNKELLDPETVSKKPSPVDLIDFRPSSFSGDRDWERFDGDH